MTSLAQNFGTNGLPSRRNLRLLAHIAAANHRTEAAIQRHFGTVGLDHLDMFKRERWVEYHNNAADAVHITAAGRSALKRMRDAARKAVA